MLNTIENEDILVTPMMFIQKYLMGGLTYAKQTGYLCAAAIVFGLIVMLFSILERKVTAQRRRRTKHSEQCAQYEADSARVTESAVVMEETEYDLH